MNPKISIVFGTYQRGQFLERSLYTYSHQPLKDIEIILIDDWSTDNTELLAIQYAKEMNLTYIRPPYKEPGVWRDSACLINQGIRAAKGNFVIITHPEVMVGRMTLSRIWDQYIQRGNQLDYICAKPYYMTPQQQAIIDTVPWKDDFTEAIRTMPHFYEAIPKIEGGPDYRPTTIEAASDWGSWVWGGMSRENWDHIGGMEEFEVWGAVDLAFLARRQALGINSITLRELDTFCVHQNHDVPGTQPDRHLGRAMAANNKSYNRQSAILRNL